MINPEKALTAARRFHVTMTVGIALLLGVAALGLVRALASPLETGQLLANLGGFDASAMHIGQAWSLVAIVASHLLLWIALLVVARRLFANMMRGDPDAAAQKARTLSYILWAMLLWGIASHALFSVAASWSYPAGERILSIGIGMPQITLFFAAAMVSFMAHALALGAELWQDHREVI